MKLFICINTAEKNIFLVGDFMLKKYALRKITIASLALIILGILYVYPVKEEEFNIPKTINYQEVSKTAIYLIDKNEYVARTNIINNNKELINNAKYLISCLTIDSKEKIYIPNGFYQIIPKNTKIIDLSLENGLLKIDFTKDFLNTSINDEEKMLQALIYSLTSLDGIKELMIFVEGTHLNKMPFSQKQLPTILNRQYGINKTYDFTNIKNTTEVTSYYLSKNEDTYYYVPITTVSNNDEEKIEIIIKQLKSRPITTTNLIGFLHSNAELVDYEILNDTINLSFNNYLLSDLNNESILEEVKYSIAYSINDTYGINTINYIVDDKKIEELVIN